jgi:molybdopterin converting factor small subunit
MNESEFNEAVKVTVRFFGPLAEAFGTPTLEIALLLGSTIRDLAIRLELGSSLEQGTRVALDGVLCSPDEEIPDAAEVAFLPPVSGG